MSKTSVITGATGLIGYALTLELIARGERPRLLLRKPSPFFEAMDCDIAIGDITVPETLMRAFAGADIVYHLAGVIELGNGNDEMVWKVNVEGTKNVVEACKACGVGCMIYASSTDAMKPAPQGEIMREAETFSRDIVNGTYAKSKAAATSLVLNSASESLHVTAILPSAVIGPYDRKFSAVGALTNFCVKHRFPVTLRFGGYNFVDVRDVAQAMCACTQKEDMPNASVYLLSGEFISIRSLIGMLSELTGHKPPRLPVPYWLAMASAPIAELVFKMIGKFPLFSRYSVRKVMDNGLFCHDKATQELGFQPRGARESLADAIQYIQEKWK